MAANINKFNGGTTSAKVSAVLGHTKKRFKQFSYWADPDNSGRVRLGGSDVTDVANDDQSLEAGRSVTFGPFNEPFVLDTESLYVVGSAAGQICYFAAVPVD